MSAIFVPYKDTVSAIFECPRDLIAEGSSPASY